MADHLHKQIRSAAVTALTGLTTSGSRVYANRLYPLDTANLPGLRISTDRDDVTVESIHSPMVLAHTLQLVVECCARASTSLDDTCDLMQKEVEIALSSGLTITGKKLDCVLTGSQYDDEAAGTPAAVKRLEFSIGYYTLNTQPDVIS